MRYDLEIWSVHPYRADEQGSADLFRKVCGSSQRSDPKAADLQNRSALRLLILARFKARLGQQWRGRLEALRRSV